VLKVEDCLFPVRRAFVGVSAESDWSREIAEWSVEPSHKRMHLVGVLHCKLISVCKLNIFLLAGNKVEVQNFARVAHDHLGGHVVDEGLFHYGWGQDTHVDSVNVVPETSLLCFVGAVFDSSDKDLGSIREHLTCFFVEICVTGPEDGIEHGLVE